MPAASDGSGCRLQAQPGAPQPLQLAKLFVPDITPGAAPGSLLLLLLLLFGVPQFCGIAYISCFMTHSAHGMSWTHIAHAGAGMSEAAFARLRAETIAMPVWELGLRAGLEIALLLIGWQVLRRAVKGLSRRGQQVSCRIWGLGFRV